MAFKDRLKEIRKELGYTQKEMAKTCGVAYATLQRYEKGSDFPAGTLFLKIAELGYNLDWLLTGGSVKLITDSMPKKTSDNQKGIIEEWLHEVRKKEGNDGRIVMELSLQVPEFREWYKEKKSKSGGAETGSPHENVA